MCALNKEKTKDASFLAGQHSSLKAEGGKVVQLWYQKKKILVYYCHHNVS